MFFARPDMEQRLREQVIGVLGVAAPAKITDLAAVQSAYGKLEAEVKKISEEAEALASISVKVTDAIGQDLKAGVVITDDKGNVVSEPDVTSPSVVFVPHGTYIVTPTFENFTDIVIPDLKRNVTVTEGQVAVVKIEIKNSLKLSFSTQVRVSRNSYKTVERNYRKLVQLKTREEMLRLFENGNYMWSSNTVSNWYVGMNFIAAKRSGVTQEQLDRALKAAHKVYPDIVEKFRHNNQEKRMGEVMQGRLKYFILLCQILSVAGDMEDSRLLVETAYTDDALAEICMTVAAYIENRLGILGNGAVASALKGNDPRVALRAALYLHYYGLDTGDDKLIEYLNGPSSTTNPYDKKLSQYVVSVLCNIHTPAVLDAMRGVLKKSIAATDYDLINIGAYAAVYLLAYGNADDWKQVSRFKFVQDSHERQLSYLTALVKNPRVLEIWEGDYERRTSPGVMSVDFSVSDETLKKPDYWNSGVLNYVLHENLAEKLREHHTGKDEKLDVYLAYHEIAHLIPSATDLFPNGVDCNIIRFGVEESDAGSLKFLFEMRPEFVDEKLRIGVTFKRMSTIGYNINIFGGRQGTHATIYNGIKDRYLSDGGKTLIGNIFLSRDGNVISLADVGDNGMGRFNYEAKLDNRDLKELYLHIELKILDNILYLDYPLFDGHYARGLRRSDSKVVKAEESAVSNPGNPDAWIAWGKALQGTGRLTEAMQKYGKAIMLDPNKDYLWYDMADMFSARGLHEEAVNAFNGAVGIYPDNPNIWYTMASKYYMNRNYPKAADAYGKVVALDPIDELSRLWQANNLFLAGLREKADKLYASLSEGAYKERAVIMRSLIGKSTVKPVTNRKLEEHLYKGYRDLFNNQLQQAKEQFTMAVKAGRPDLLERRMAEVELESLKTLLEKAENK